MNVIIHFKMGARLSRAKTARPSARDMERFRRIPETQQEAKAQSASPSTKDGDEALLQRLSGVYVETTRNTVPVVNPFGEGLKQSERRLPERRTALAASAHDSVAIPRGFMTSDQVVELLSHRKEDPSRWTPQLAAEKYGVNAAEAEQLLKHFGNLQIVAKLKIDAKLESNPD